MSVRRNSAETMRNVSGHLRDVAVEAYLLNLEWEVIDERCKCTATQQLLAECILSFVGAVANRALVVVTVVSSKGWRSQ